MKAFSSLRDGMSSGINGNCVFGGGVGRADMIISETVFICSKEVSGSVFV